MKQIIIGLLTGVTIFCGMDAVAQNTVVRPQMQKSTHKPAYNVKNVSKRSTPRQATPSTEAIYKKLADEYTWNSELSDGMILVSDGDKFGFVNRLGEEVIPLFFDGASDFYDGEAVVVANEQSGVIDHSGNYIIPAEYEYIYPVSEGFYCVKKGGKWGYIDKHGIKLTDMIYDAAFPFAGGLGVVQSATKQGAIDKAGNEIIPVVFDVVEIDGETDIPVGVELRGRTAPIDSTLNVDFSKLYDEISDFGKLGPKDLALVKINGSFGIVNKKMHEVVEPRYQLIAPFRHGFARVNRNGRYNF
ncbi:MAG: WG repeat-containing protein, partial [Paramuribaculum sp.]|nr:WG repeat-containing protein [Paramuribaculum sp.]